MATKYEQEVIDILLRTKGQAVVLVVLDGAKGSSFEVRATSEKYMRRLPAALIEMASRIEGQLNEKDMEVKRAEAEKKSGKDNK